MSENQNQHLLCCKNAFAADSFLISSPEELMKIATCDYYQHILRHYRSTGHRDEKLQMFGIIPQGVRRNIESTRHWAVDLRPSGVIYCDDDRPASEISADERHRLVQERLAERGLTHISYTGMRSSSGKYHLLIEALDPTKSFMENHRLWEELFEGVLVLDHSCRVLNKILFFTGEVYGGIQSLEWLFQPHNCCMEEVNDNDNDNDNCHPEANCQFTIHNSQLTIVNYKGLSRASPTSSMAAHWTCTLVHAITSATP